jgi:hypothetical protein
MRNDVVNICRQCLFGLLLTLHAEGMLSQVSSPDLAPTTAVVDAWVTLRLTGWTVASLHRIAASAQAVAQRG